MHAVCCCAGGLPPPPGGASPRGAQGDHGVHRRCHRSSARVQDAH